MITESHPAAETNSAGSGSGKTAKFKEDEFVRLRRAKNALKPESLTDSDEGMTLLPFIKECFSYRFADAPNYEKLRFFLMKVLLDNDEMADNQFDWNIGYAVEEESLLPKPTNTNFSLSMQPIVQQDMPMQDEKDDGVTHKK